MSHIGWGGEQTIIYKGVETRVLCSKGGLLKMVENVFHVG